MEQLVGRDGALGLFQQRLIDRWLGRWQRFPFHS